MDPENNNKTASDADNTRRSVSFSHISTVATGWMLDFTFVSLCRRFKEDKLDEFNEALSTFQAISQSSFLDGNLHAEKIMVCAFLSRVMHGKQLDVFFEEDESVMPLMSAAQIWSTLEPAVEDKSLFKNITVLLLVQSVAVCLEKGQRSSASSALKWFQKNHEIPQSVGGKLSTIVTKRETYHPFLVSFSYSCLLETVQSYLDAFLEKNPSDYLLKAATEVAQLSQNIDGLEDAVSQDSKPRKESTENDRNKTESAGSVRSKRKLLSTKTIELWEPGTGKKPYVCLRRLSQNELSQTTSGKSLNTSKVQNTRKPPKKWTPHLDNYLKAGVKRHGQGKWSRILLDYDFEGRTGTMLKDRWRVLMKTRDVR